MDGPALRRSAAPAPSRPALSHRRGRRRLYAGQFVALEVALAILLSAAERDSLAVLTVSLASIALGVGAFVRLRDRWLYQWLIIAVGYLVRRRSFASPVDARRLLDLFAPHAAVLPTEMAGRAAAVIVDGRGLTALVALGDATGLLAETSSLPPLADLLSAVGPGLPPVRLQQVVSVMAAPPYDGGVAGAAYRQLTGGQVPGRETAVLAVRMHRAEGWSEEDLRRALSSTVRKVCRRLGPVPAGPLNENAIVRVLAEMTQHDGGQPGRETWRAVRSSGLWHATFRLERVPVGPQPIGGLLQRLLTLPAVATTVSLSVGSGHGAPDAYGEARLVVRLSAGTVAALESAAQALHQLVDADGGYVERMDGRQWAGLVAALPLGPVETPVYRTSTGVRHPAAAAPDSYDLRGNKIRSEDADKVPRVVPDDTGPPIGRSGLVVGLDRRAAPVTVRLLRAQPTRVLLVGGLAAAALITLRAMALGARPVVRTARPQAWEPFVRGVGAPGTPIPVLTAGQSAAIAPGSPLHPVLLVVDEGMVDFDPQADAGWQTCLIVREELAPLDRAALARADLVLLQPLSADEAAHAAAALGLGESAQWLSRIQDDMVAVVNRRTVRWARLAVTPIETQFVGGVVRHRQA